MAEFNHYSVMLHETVDMLSVREDGVYVDCTLGGGGHSLEIVKKLKSGKLICIDRDMDAIEAAKKRLAGASIDEVHAWVEATKLHLCHQLLDASWAVAHHRHDVGDLCS